MKAHIIGIAGSGKTTLAACMARESGVPAIDLDYVVYERGVGCERAPDADALKAGWRRTRDVRRQTTPLSF